MPALQPLPIDALLGDILAALERSRAVVLEAPPGAGKTTRVPWAALAAASGSVIVSEPRRVAARMAAERVARERGEELGLRVGYSVRFESRTSRETRLVYVTDGVLERRLLEDPELRGVDLVVLDEFHERRLATDVILALLRRLQEGPRPDLRLLVMSATLDGQRLRRALGDCPLLTSEGRLHPVTIEHAPKPDDRPLESQVASAVRELGRSDKAGDVLVFLPGAAEIRRAQKAVERVAAEAEWLILPLHGDLPLAEQRRALEPADRRKLILSTNVAESSITVDGVTAVVDSGLERRAWHSPWSGLPRLGIAKISRASAAQRAGRAGRTAPGRVLRLYTRADHDARPEHELPEILRSDLTETVLGLRGVGVTDPAGLPWLDAPTAAQLGAADELLIRLGALDAGRALTPVGRRMLRFRTSPRLARLLVEAENRGVARDACVLVGLLGERDPRSAKRPSFGAGSERRVPDGSADSDLIELLELFEEAARDRFEPRTLRARDLDPWTLRNVDRARSELARMVRDRCLAPADREQALGLSLLAGFIDRVARRRWPDRPDLILASGDTARLAAESLVNRAPLLLAIDTGEQSGRLGGMMVRLASAIEPEWLLEVAPDSLEERHALVWNESTERVEEITTLGYGAVVLEETKRRASPSPEASETLASAARAQPGVYASDQLEQLALRLELFAHHEPTLAPAEFVTRDAERLLVAACSGRTSLAELRGLDLTSAVLSTLTGEQRRFLETELPERVTLPGGRRVVVRYERGKPPFVASRLQDFFGMLASPRLCRGKVILTLHLLAPNQRAVQVTNDLGGFWQRHYPTIRRELMRKYPKHAWPEDGAHAAAPSPRERGGRK